MQLWYAFHNSRNIEIDRAIENWQTGEEGREKSYKSGRTPFWKK